MYCYKIVTLSLLILFLSACGGGGGNETSNVSEEIVLTGAFIDSPVFGLNYKTPSRSGKTNIKGEFNYLEGETIEFSIGSISLGSAIGNPIITPLSLVPQASGPTDSQVTNIVRLLITLDRNNRPEDGIEITTEIDNATTDINIDFSATDFEIDKGIQSLLTALPVQRVLVDIAAAQAHFNATLLEQSSWGSMQWGKGSLQQSDFLDQ